MSCKHRSAGNKHGRYIDPCRRHQKTGHIFVAVRHHDQRVKLMRDRHAFGGIRDQVTGHQGIFHPDMSHRDTVTDSNRRENDGRAACFRHAHPHSVNDFVDVHMAGNDFVVGTDDADHWFFDFFGGVAQCVQEASRRGLLHSCFHVVALHVF